MSEQPFCDYYEDLQVSPNADLETIERVYRLLAKKYHPDNKTTGNIDRFEILTSAYRILSNPEKRAAFDANYEAGKTEQWRAISRAYASKGFESDRSLRRTILSFLYTRRREDPSNAGTGIVQLENLMGWPEKQLDFHIWYLKEKGLIQRTDTGGYEITAKGVDQIETEGLVLRKDRLLTRFSSETKDDDKVYYIEEADPKKTKTTM
jgi:curved DNA-binding protein CbpA